VPSIEFKDAEVWPKVEEFIKSRLVEDGQAIKRNDGQLVFWD